MRFKTVFGSIVMMLLGCVGAQAADGDRWQETQQGRKFWFRVVSESDATVAYSTTGKDQPQTEDFNYLGGRVAHNGKTYTAVAVDENAFRGNVKLSAVRFDATVADKPPSPLKGELLSAQPLPPSGGRGASNCRPRCRR